MPKFYLHNGTIASFGRYDFIGIKGSPGKMSSSKGKVVDLPDLLRVYQPEVVRYLFAGTRPNTEFVISFDLDVIKIYEDYDKTERIYWGTEKAKDEETRVRESRIYELSQVQKVPSEAPYQVPFRHLCNLLLIFCLANVSTVPSFNAQPTASGQTVFPYSRSA